MKRPLLWVLGFLAFGIIIGRAPAFSSLNPALLFSLSLGLGLIVCGFLYQIWRYKAVFIFVLFMLVGLWRVGDCLHSYVDHAIYVEFRGVVMDVGRTRSGNQRAIIKGQIYECANRFRIMAYIRPYQPQVSLGQEVVVTGYLQPLSRAANPGGYDQLQHLRSQKVDSFIWPDEISPGEVHDSLMVILRRFRDRLANVYDNLLPSREGGVIKSMILGDRLDMDQDLASQYRMMGIFHILSISGMHVTILTMAAFSLLKLVMSERKAGIIVLGVMIAYCLMTGASVPTVRAVTMGGVLVFGRILYRDYDLLASVSFAGIALLVYEPLYLFNLGFQLSFGAVFGIGVLKTPIERALMLLKFPAGKFRGSLSVGISAVVASYIIFAHHLYEIPLYSVIGNIVIMPTVTVLLVLGVLVGLIGLVWMPGAGILAGPVYYILRFYEVASNFFASLPGAMALTGGGSIAVTAAGVGVLLAFAFAFSGFGEDFRKRLPLLFVAVIVLVACVFIRDFPRDMRVTALYTHGQYAVIRHRNNMLIIGNGRGGEGVLLSYMNMRGTNRAHGLVLTEPPRTGDIRRIEAILPRIQVLYLPGGLVLPDALREAASTNSVEIIWLYDKDMLLMGEISVQGIIQPGLQLDLRVSFNDAVVDFVWDERMLEDAYNVTISSGNIALGDRIYYTHTHGAIQIRTNGRQVRYWVMLEDSQ